VAPVSVHATGIVIGKAGLVIRGASRAGKSSLALALLDVAAQAGLFSALIGDDRLLLSASDGHLIARGHPAILGQIEQRGVGILSVPWEPEAKVRCVVDILPPEQAVQRSEAVNPSVTLCGIDLPLLAVAKAGSVPGLARAVFAWFRQFGAI
jgi:HPr kinase/phosphorylase